VVLADNHFPPFVAPICEGARARGIPVVLDIDKPADICDPLMPLVSHPIFSAEALGAGTGIDDLPRALTAAGKHCPGFVAVTDGNNGAYWCADATHNPEVRHQPAFTVEAADTLAAGDVFHAAFALALAEGRPESEAIRFASAAAALKCTPRWTSVVLHLLGISREPLVRRQSDSYGTSSASRRASGSLILLRPARTVSASSNRGEPHEAQGGHQTA
jgi:hypothetical protein